MLLFLMSGVHLDGQQSVYFTFNFFIFTILNKIDTEFQSKIDAQASTQYQNYKSNISAFWSEAYPKSFYFKGL